MVYGVILAGDKGERLWPLSRRCQPKQFLAVGDQPSLLEQTIDRLAHFIAQEKIFLIIAEQQEHLLSPEIKKKVGTILKEPVQRNTAPALIYAAEIIVRQDPEAILLVVPADHAISPVDLFIEDAQKAITFCRQHDALVLFGIRPTHPATGYGYLECAQQNDDQPQPVHLFHEKPSRAIAQHYCTQQTMLWNSGMFCAQAKVFIKECQSHAPEIFQAVTTFLETGAGYDQASSLSIDYAILEKSNKVYALPARFSWSDVGNLEVFLKLVDQNSMHDHVIAHNAENNLLMTRKLTVLLGVHDLCVIETDDVLLIAHRNQVEEVKAVVAELAKRGQVDCL